MLFFSLFKETGIDYGVFLRNNTKCKIYLDGVSPLISKSIYTVI